MKDRICVVTGATSGIGRETARQLAQAGATMVLCGRDAKMGNRVRRDLVDDSKNGEVHFVCADLSLLQNVREMATSIRRGFPRVDVLINNAAVISRDRTVTTEGFELQWVVNYLSGFLLTHLLMPSVRLSEAGRIVNVASHVHHAASMDFTDLTMERGYEPRNMYNRTKLANIVFTYELARRLAGTSVTSNCLHPGVVETKLLSAFRGRTGALGALRRLGSTRGLAPERGAVTSVYLASSDDVRNLSGKYFDSCREVTSSTLSRDGELARRLWTVSRRQCSGYMDDRES